MFEELLARIARVLVQRQIPYMVIGGQAVLLHGEPRLTRDIDITLGLGLERLSELLEAIPAAQLVALVDPMDFTTETMVLPCRDAGGEVRVDFILSSSVYEREAIARGVDVELCGTDVRFASPEDLVIHKLIAGRPRDLEDVRSVLLKNPRLDRARVRAVLLEFERALDERFVPRLEEILRTIGP